MEELVLKKRKYIQYPEQIEGNSLTIEKLTFHYCNHLNLKLSDQEWPQLQYIEIIGCKYLELSLDFPSGSFLKQIYMASTEYVDIYDVKGQLSNLHKWTFEQSKYIKFKGRFQGDIGLQNIEFINVPYVEIFKAPAHLPNLKSLTFEGCGFLKLSLKQLTAPRLHRLWFINSNYITLYALGPVEGQLNSFKFENCAYPKFKDVDFSKLMQISNNSQSSSEVENLEDIDGINPFRKVNFTEKPKRIRKHVNPDDPDIELIRTTPTPEEALTSANAFLNNSQEDSTIISSEIPISRNLNQFFLDNLKPKGNTQSNQINSQDLKRTNTSNEIKNPKSIEKGEINKKFCPNCGHSNLISATFCASCGTKFRMI